MQVVLPPPTPARAGATEVGMASWYGHPYHGRTTSNGETYDMRQMTAAHLSLPFGTRVRVTNLGNGRSVELRINDRGPFSDNRILDVSRAAAERLRMVDAGLAKVRLEVIAAPGMAAKPRVRPAAVKPAAVETAACSSAGHGVQVGSFRNPANARGVLAGLDGRYGPARVVSAAVNGGTLYRVVIGSESPAAARATLAKVQADGLDGFVTRVAAQARCLSTNAG